jgi:hypothetical protein
MAQIDFLKSRHFRSEGIGRLSFQTYSRTGSTYHTLRSEPQQQLPVLDLNGRGIPGLARIERPTKMGFYPA